MRESINREIIVKVTKIKYLSNRKESVKGIGSDLSNYSREWCKQKQGVFHVSKMYLEKQTF